MSAELTWGAVTFFLGIAFSTGIHVNILRQVRKEVAGKADLKDVNNIGSKVNRVSDQADRRSRNIELAVMTIAPPLHRDKIVGILKGE